MILEDAAALYRAMKERGLDLRSNHGRDRALLAELAGKLNCPDLNLQVYLDNHPEIPAEIFLREFLRIAEPFAKMFEEIWQYLAEHVAPAASEMISVRFGLDAARSETVDLEAFRRYVDSARFVLAVAQLETWPRPALAKLFDLQRIFTGRDTDPAVAARVALVSGVNVTRTNWRIEVGGPRYARQNQRSFDPAVAGLRMREWSRGWRIEDRGVVESWSART